MALLLYMYNCTLTLNDAVDNISYFVLFVLALMILMYKQVVGGAVYIIYGSGKFTRVHFKDNTATAVSNLLFTHNIYFT